jgi:hypothetical protein
MLAADLLLAAGNGEAIGNSWIPVLALAKEIHQIADAAEIGAGFVNPAAAGTAVEVDAPAIGSHHREVELPLGFVKGPKGVLAFARIQSAARAALADALPSLFGTTHPSCFGFRLFSHNTRLAVTSHHSYDVTSHHSGDRTLVDSPAGLLS